MRDMEERGEEEESEGDGEESDVILGSEGESVCERESVCFDTRSILFSQNLKQSNRNLK